MSHPIGQQLNEALPARLSSADVAALRKYSTPTVANAIENLIGIKPVGSFTAGGVQCQYPQFGVMTGYACTATSLSAQPPRTPRQFPRRDYWEYINSAPLPRVVVMQELSAHPLGAFWGEVHANIHRGLKCEGLITNGLIRDMDEVQALGFHFFSSGIGVSHAHAHLEDYDRQVSVFGMTVNSGDLIHADKHGALVIPMHVAGQVAKACEDLMRDEIAIIQLCQSADFSLDALDKLVSPDY